MAPLPCDKPDQDGGTWRMRQGGLVKRSFSLAGHRTSVALEPEFWDALAAIAEERAMTMAGFVASVDAERDPERPLASALRVMALLHTKKGG